MNFPSPTQSLQARAQPGGITPELIRLLAQMKVKQETDAAARDMAMKMGQQPPTVAEGLNEELEGNWRQKLEQKLGGLQALAQQQAPQGAPTMPAPPAQPTQHMAAGGLTKLRSNLPGNYAGGGIVAFDGGGPAWKNLERRADETSAEYVARVERAKAEDPSFSASAGPAALLKALFSHRGVGAYPEEPPEAGVPDVNRQQLQGEAPAQQAAPAPSATPKAPPAAARKPAAPPASGQKAGVAAIPQNVVPVAAPVPGLQADYETNARKDINADPAMAGLIERTASKERRQAELGGDEAALRAARRQDEETHRTRFNESMAATKPNLLSRLALLGANARGTQYGNAALQMDAAEQNWQDRNSKGLAELLKRKGEVDAMSLADKKATFDYAEGRGTAAQTAVADSRKGALTSAGQLLAQRGQDAAHLQGIGMNNETQLKVANIQAASDRAAAKIVADRQDQADKRNDITGLKSEIAAAEKSLAKYTPQVLMLLTPGTPEHAAAIQDMAWAKAVREANRARLAELTGVEYKTAPAAAVAVPAGVKVSKVAGT